MLNMTSEEQAIRAACCYRALKKYMIRAGAENAVVTVEKDEETEDLLILEEIKEAIKMLYERGSENDI